MRKMMILVQIISTLGTLASIFWLYLDPSLEALAASVLCLAGIFGSAVQADKKLKDFQDKNLLERLESIKQIREITDNIPRMNSADLYNLLLNDSEIRRSLTMRLVRIFGLRRELIPNIEPELIELIDSEFENLYDIAVGSYHFKDEKLYELAVCAEKLAKTVLGIEERLMKEYKTLF